MNFDVAKELYYQKYCHEMSFEEFKLLLTMGISLVENKSFSNHSSLQNLKPVELKSVNIALAYNEELIVKALLMENP